MKKLAVFFATLVMMFGVIGPAQAVSRYESHVFSVDTIVSEIGVAWTAQSDGAGLLFYQMDFNTTSGCSTFKSDGNGKYTNIIFRTYTPTTHTLVATKDLGDGYNCAFSKYYINTPGPDDQGSAYVTINYDVRTITGTYHNSGGFNVCWNGPTVC